jgi:hypothetical protein
LLDSTGDLIGGMEHALCKYSIEPVISYRDQITSIYFDSAFSVRADSLGHVDVSIGNISEIKKRVDIEIEGIHFRYLPIEMEKRIHVLFSKLKIYYPQFIIKHEFIFDEDISNINDWVKLVKEYYIEKGNNVFQAETLALKDQDILTNQIATFNIGNKIYVSALSFDSQPIEHLVLREMLRGSVVITDEIKSIYSDKKKTRKVAYGVAIYKNPFISYLAEESEIEYLLESLVFYVIQPNKLKYVDEKIFNYIENNIDTILGEPKDEV